MVSEPRTTDNSTHAIESKEEGKEQDAINQAPHLTWDTIWESDKNTRKHHTQKS